MLEEEEHRAAGDQVAADGRGEVAADGRGVVAAEGEGCCWLLSAAAAAAGPRSARARSPSSPYPSNLEEVYPQEVGPGCTFGRMMLYTFLGPVAKLNQDATSKAARLGLVGTSTREKIRSSQNSIFPHATLNIREPASPGENMLNNIASI